MYKYQFTVGLNDKDSEKQEIKTSDAKNIISKILLNDFEIFAFTMIDCYGVYKMQSTGAIVQEASVRIEIASDEQIPELNIIDALKKALNQESIMIETSEADINFR